MATVRFTTIPCEPNTAEWHEEDHLFSGNSSLYEQYCVWFRVVRTILRVFVSIVGVFVCKNVLLTERLSHLIQYGQFRVCFPLFFFTLQRNVLLLSYSRFCFSCECKQSLRKLKLKPREHEGTERDTPSRGFVICHSLQSYL